MSDKRKRLIESALELFVLNGFQGTPTSQVAKHAGVATGTLFHHFDSKADLIQCVYQHCVDLRAEHSTISDGSLTVKQRLKDLFLGRIAWGLSNSAALTFIHRFENSAFASPDDELLKDPNLVALIQEGQSSRKLRLIDAALLQLSVESLLDSATRFYSRYPEKYQDEMHKYSSFNFFWTALKY